MLSDLSVILQPFRTDSGAHWCLNLNIRNPRGGATINMIFFSVILFLSFYGGRERGKEDGWERGSRGMDGRRKGG